MQIYFILLNIYFNFLHVILHPLSLPDWILFERRNSVIVRPVQHYLAPKPRIYYQNICILPRKIPINIQITYFCTWNSLTFRRFQLSAILFAFLQTKLDRFFFGILENTDFLLFLVQLNHKNYF